MIYGFRSYQPHVLSAPTALADSLPPVWGSSLFLWFLSHSPSLEGYELERC